MEGGELVDNLRQFNGIEFYNSLCMKIVNQTVGRAVRHKNDYASIILIDKRFKNHNIVSAMPKWIVDQKQMAESEVDLKKQLDIFFKHMKAKYTASN